MFRFPSRPVASPRPAARPTVDVAALVASVAGMAVAGPLINDIAGVGPLAIALWRNLISVTVMVPVLLWRHRDRPPVLPWKDLVATLTAGLLFAAYLGLWIPSLRLTSVAASTGLSFAVAPVWVMIIRRVQGEHLPARAWAGTFLAVAGVLALTGIDRSLPVRHLIGDLLALASGIAVAGYLVLGARARARVETPVYTTLCYGTAATALAVICHVTGTPTTGYPLATWGKIAALTLSVQLVGHSLNTHAVKTLGIGVTSTAILLETPGATVIEGLWHRTWPGPAVVAAVLVILTGLALVVRAQHSTVPSGAPTSARATRFRLPPRLVARTRRTVPDRTGARRDPITRHRWQAPAALAGIIIALAAADVARHWPHARRDQAPGRVDRGGLPGCRAARAQAASSRRGRLRAYGR